MKKFIYFYIVLLLVLGIFRSAWTSDTYSYEPEKEHLLKRRTFASQSVKAEEGQTTCEVKSCLAPVLEQYLLYCEEQQMKCNLTQLEESLKLLSQNPKDRASFMKTASYIYRVPEHLLGEFYEHFKSIAAKEQAALEQELRELERELGAEKKLASTLAPYCQSYKITDQKICIFFRGEAPQILKAAIELALAKYYKEHPKLET